MKTNLYILFLILLCAGCSDTSSNEGEIKDEYAAWKYVNAFAHGAMDKYYLWKNEIGNELDAWDWDWSEPKAKVENIRYKDNGEEVDKWTRVFDNYSEATSNISTTYGFEYALFRIESSKQVVLITTVVYPDSPAEKAGLKRGNLIVALNNEPITIANSQQLKSLSSVELVIQTSSGQKVIGLKAVSMYEDPVLLDSIYYIDNKKVGYLVYNRFDVSSCEKLISVCKRFKKEEISELILDLRYNLGGTSVVHQLLASMLAPEQNVFNNEVYLKRFYNKEYAESLQEEGEEMAQYLQPKMKWTMNGKDYTYDISEANVGITKLYALVTGQTASASEALLIGLKPYLDIEIIGETTRGKFCGGYYLSASDWYQEQIDTYEKEGRDFYAEFPDLTEWKSYVADWGMYMVVDYFTDKNGGKPDFRKGLVPTFNAVDAPYEGYSLGDKREAMLQTVLERIGKSDVVSRINESCFKVEDYKLIEYSSSLNLIDNF